MATVGERLRLARERAGLSVDDIFARTKIQGALLEAIERDDFERVPGGLFVRGFLRAYAREVGLEPEAVVADYIQQHQPAPAVSVEDTPRPPTDGRKDVILAQRDFEAFSWRKLVPAAAVAAIVIGIFAMNGSRSTDAPVAEVQAEPVGTSGTAAAPPREPAPGPSEPLSLEMRAKRDVWVAATADGQRVMYRILKAGEHASITGRSELTARIGDAEALEYSVNGVAGQPLGAAAEVRDIIMTPGSFRTFKVDRPPPPKNPGTPDPRNPGTPNRALPPTAASSSSGRA
jgi:transcriptional regulator with XRE-family HTH domain